MTKEPWNKNKSVGQKKAFTPRQIEELRGKLIDSCMTRDLALLDFAVESGFEACKMLKIRVFEVKASKRLFNIASNLITKQDKEDSDYLFSGNNKGPLSRERYTKLIKKWSEMINLDPMDYATKSIHRKHD